MTTAEGDPPPTPTAAAAAADAADAADLARAVGALRLVTLYWDRYRIATSVHFGLSVMEAQVIAHLLATGPMALGDLAASMQMRSSVITGVIDRLETKGMVERNDDPQDRRRRILTLSGPRSQELREFAPRLAGIFSRLTPQELAAAGVLLEKVAQGLEDFTAEVVATAPVAPAPRRVH